MAHHNIAQIDASQTLWNVKAKIVRLWLVPDFNRPNLPFSLEMVLLDGQGKRIHATIRRTLIYKFKNEITEGKVYSFESMGVASNGGSYRTTQHAFKLNFQFSTKIFQISNASIDGSPYEFIEIPDILGGTHDTDFLVDVIGVLTEVETEREIEKNGKTHKLNVIVLEALGHRINCTLFGNYVDDLNTFMATGDLENAVVIIQLAKVKNFQDKYSLQNCMNCTKLVFNPTCPSGKLMRKRLIDDAESPAPITLTQMQPEPKLNVEEEFLYRTQRITIQALKDVTQDSLFVVLGTITQILNPENWWYTSCSCSKSVYPDSKMYFCEKCDKHVVTVYPRYCLKVQVMDNHDSATLVIFDKEATLLFNKSCDEMLHQKTGGQNNLPPDITALVGTEMLFKVETKPNFNLRFEPSFKVRKICTSKSTIELFKKKWDHEDAVFLKNNNESLSLSALAKTEGLENIAHISTNVLALTQDSDPNTTNDKGKVKVKVMGIDCNDVSEDLMPKFALAEEEVEVDLTDLTEIEAAKPDKRLSPVEEVANPLNKTSSNEKATITPLVISDELPLKTMKSVKRPSPTEKVASDELPFKTMIKRKIKIEKN